jgi:hypothetical protein
MKQWNKFLTLDATDNAITIEIASTKAKLSMTTEEAEWLFNMLGYLYFRPDLQAQLDSDVG